jgi:O-antigen/teichoic acid export membrane protein
METETLETAEQTENRAADATRKHIRGSSLLFFGRLVMLGLNFGVQVLTVRYLTKNDYGAFAFAMSFVAVSAVITLFGLDKAVSRFMAIYHEQKDYPRLFGTIVMTVAVIFSIGILLIAAVLLFRGQLGSLFQTDPVTVSLLVIVIAIGPINAFESYFEDMLAVFASVRSIFVRRYILGPILKLLAVLVVVLLNGSVNQLALGYLAGSLIGLVVYVLLIVNVLKTRGLLQHFNPKTFIYPLREVFGFSVPLLTTDFLQVVKGSAVVLMLEYFRTSSDVAEYRAVVPVAGLNLVVMQSFRLLYTPMAARMYANNDRQGINALYWKTATWIALISFPVFLVTFSLAQPMTILLFGERYAQSGIVLALLSFGNFFNAALGFNTYTLRVFGRVKYIMLIDVISSLANLGLNFVLIPQYGALGAAVGTAATLVIYNLLNHAGLLLGTGINLFERRYLAVYASIILASASLIALQTIFNPHVAISLLFAAAVSLLLLRVNRKVLDVENTFPELLRMPLLRPILGV